MWYYPTPIGVLKIVKTSYGYGFLFDDDPTDWTGHDDPRALADDVFNHATGYTKWDSSGIEGPQDLSEWIYVNGDY